MNTVAKHTGYILINEDGNLEMISYSPDQNLSGQKASDSYALAQGLFLDQPSHDWWLEEVDCYRVVGTPSGLQTVKGLKCEIVAKQQYDWDMSLTMGHRMLNRKKSNDWNRLFIQVKANHDNKRK